MDKPANDVTVRIQSVNTTGGVLAQTHTGTAVHAGTGLSVFGSHPTIRNNYTEHSTEQHNYLQCIGNYAGRFFKPMDWSSGNAFIVVIQSMMEQIIYTCRSSYSGNCYSLQQDYNIQDHRSNYGSGWQGFVYARPDPFRIDL